tara:strand:+ start:77 stop:352 length:276 start_codon:yes stop_codon:yes gene_type:complete
VNHDQVLDRWFESVRAGKRMTPPKLRAYFKTLRGYSLYVRSPVGWIKSSKSEVTDALRGKLYGDIGVKEVGQRDEDGFRWKYVFIYWMPGS